MSVILELDVGWFVDHQLNINNTYACTENCISENEDYSSNDYETTTEQLHDGRSCVGIASKYECDPELFAIWHPFVMDSQFCKSSVERQNSVSSYVGDGDRDSTVDNNFQGPDEQKAEDCPTSLCEDQNALENSILSHEHSRSNKKNSVDTVGFDVDQSGNVQLLQTKKRKRKRKRPLNLEEEAAMEENHQVSSMLTTALNQLHSILLRTGYDSAVTIQDNNLSARHAAATKGLGDFLVQSCLAEAKNDDLSQPTKIDSLGANVDLCNTLIDHPGENAIVRKLMGHTFLIPPQTRFLMSDFCHMEALLDETRYDCIVIDPPWENKSVKRKKLYNTLTDFDLLRLPIKQLCNEDSVVFVWVTNKQRQQRFVVERLFPLWNLKYLTKWYWLKVTKSLQPVCDLASEGFTKKPYECILVGCASSDSKSRYEDIIPQEQVIISVPCSLHSRKPPLNEILQPYLKLDPKCLELFARSLLPSWTSWGNEVLAFQHIDFFQKCTDNASAEGAEHQAQV